MVETVKQDGEVAFSYMKSWDREARIREEGRKEGHAEGRAEERKKRNWKDRRWKLRSDGYRRSLHAVRADRRR